MPVLHDEIPDEGDFDNVTPEDFTRRASNGTPPGWLSREAIERARQELPIVYVEIVPVHADGFGRVTEVGVLLHMSEDGSIERTLIAGRVLYHETLREAVARNIAKDLGDIALPIMPQTLQPFTIAEFFPTPGMSEFYDPRQHAVALCYVVPISGDCKPQDETLNVEWHAVDSLALQETIAQMNDGHGLIVRKALAWIN